MEIFEGNMVKRETQKLQELIEEADNVFSYIPKRKESKPLYEKALKIAKSDKKKLETEYIQGKLDLVNRKWSEACEHFDKIIKLASDFHKAWNYKGFALIKLKQYDKALKCYDKVLKIDPKYLPALNGKGAVFGNLGRVEEALKYYDKVLKIDPKYLPALTGKGVVLGNLRGDEEEMKWYDKVLKIDPKYLPALTNKGAVLDKSGRSEEALKCYDKVLKIDPDSVIALTNKGIALGNLGRDEEEMKYYDKALKIDPNSVHTLSSKGALLGNSGRVEEALKYYDKALKIDPNSVIALTNKGIVLSKLSHFEEALKYYDKALKIDPTYSDARERRNLLLTILHKKDAPRERKKLYSEKKNEIEKSEIPDDVKREKILEIDAIEEVIKELTEYKEILKSKKDYEDKLAISLKPRDKPLKENFFLVLRRWNSYTPLMLTTTESNLGGGYFLYWKGKGIVIDPGFDFLDNFLNNELSAHDIDAIIITHAHVDHCNDLGSILTLLFEYNKENREKKKIDLFLNLGAMKKFLGWIPIDTDENDSIINRIYPLDRGISYKLENYNLRLTATDAIHEDILCKCYPIGLIIELFGKGNYTEKKPFKIGYTSDTEHDKSVEMQYEGVDIIVPHLGSVDLNDFIKEDKKVGKNHLMLKGVISTIQISKAKLAIVSEFGEELREHRVTIVGSLDKVFQRNKMAKCLTGDIGLKVSIPNLKAQCHYCNKWKPIKDIKESIDPYNKVKKSVIYYCKNCENIYEHYFKEAKKREAELAKIL
jgi:tetratricopeptide (TPR) repeat protein